MKFLVKQKHLRGMLNLAAKKDVRFYLMALHFVQDQRGTIIEATDGTVCGRLLIDDTPKEPAKVLIGTPEIKSILSKRADDIVQFEVNGDSVTAYTPNAQTVFKRMDGTFPDCNRVTPKAGYEIVAAHYNPALLVRFAKAAEDFGAREGHIYLRQNGQNPALVTMQQEPLFVGVVITMRGTVIDVDVPAWSQQ